MNTIAIIGEGMLADAVYKRLSRLFPVRRKNLSEDIPAVDLVLVLKDEESSSYFYEAEQMLRLHGIPWLCAYVSLGEGIIGPLIVPGTTGCFKCAEARLSLAGSNRNEVKDLLMKLVYDDYTPHNTSEISPAGASYMAYIISAETEKVLRGDRANTEEHLYLINLTNLSSTIHYVMPLGTCPVCGQVPDDSAELAEISLQKCLKQGNSYRCRGVSDLKKVLLRDYWDSRTGIFNDKKWGLDSVFASAGINLPLGFYDEITGGRSHSFPDSELAGILEGLERFCGVTPRGKRTIVRDSYSHLKAAALDPSMIGLHAEEQYEQSDFPFMPYDPESPMEWVWGYSFLQARPILVPKLLAYYSLGGEEGFVYETSNGCAVGGSLEEAILYGIFEVVERDSFLLTWYARLEVPRLDYNSSGDSELILMIQRLRAVTGYEVSLYNTTMENGIPSIWALAKGGSKDRVNLICAAGAHLDPIRAAKSAIHELAGMIPTAERRLKERRPEAEAMLDDPFLVEHMEDHSLLYSLPQAEERLHFLMDERNPVRTFAEEFHSMPWQEDLTEDLKQILQVFRSLQMEVIVVDQSSSEILRNGLRCVKVLIPGMLPMTFGHHLTRLIGLNRVLDVPMKLGYANHRLTPQELNPYPHPFP
ncbi:TOMM precursor leader peptide-binding protein [Paenibacillus motobuensis]|uniref:TOMM precursor leader peptide-binding protein n=1 Tax=Paenibacillus TaxID=44249 RepID=UPI00203B6FE7|nr:MULTISPECIES: TOMM precursor leader peptide-binding protein [Paenibacillus]MCM3038735.1 TOMM precursor leader peptide-binding protein [Paenibacillus lutimineralis]MCM3645839.1 TOMM precursor leader peptide-binding protein [Paenibacillus motobuensis]